MPNNCIFLVDTYDTLAGVEKAVRVAAELRRRGHEMVGVRLDSGDLGPLSLQVRQRLDAAGFPAAKIVASNDLDADKIERLKAAGAAIDIWGVGTRLITAYEQPALGGVFKLAALATEEGTWEKKMKLSEDALKISNPGPQQVRRFSRDGQFLADVIYDSETFLPEPCVFHPADGGEKVIEAGCTGQDLLRQMVVAGKLLAPSEPLDACRERAREQLASLPTGILARHRPTTYPVGLGADLARHKQAMIAKLRQKQS